MTPPPPHKPWREAHAHLPWHGRALSMLSLSVCPDAEECLELLKREAERMRDANDPGWLLAHGARVQAWREPRWPARAAFEAVTGSRPCCVMSFDHHAVLANTAAVRSAGLPPDPPGGIVVRDESTGEPTGELREQAAFTVWNAAPPPPPARRERHLRAALDDLTRLGCAEVHDLFSPAWLGPALAALDDAGELPLRVGLFAPLDELGTHAEASSSWRRGRVALLGGKIFVDGTLSGRTAWMLSPYADPLKGLERGKPLMSVDAIAAAIARCAGLGLTLAAHAIGDAAVRAVLDAVERVRPPAGTVRIEHAEIIDRADVPRFAALGVTASVQPCHLLADAPTLRRALPHRLDRVMPLRELLESGLTAGESLVFGSDVPVVRPDPSDSILAATRGGFLTGISPEQAIDERTAWACFTGPRASDEGPGQDRRGAGFVQ